MKVIFVCTGNTCRSPMAEGFMRYYIEKYSLNMEVLSRGIMVREEIPANDRAIHAMDKFSQDIRSHRAMRLKQHELDDDMLIITMTKNHLEYIDKNYILEDGQLHTLAGFVGEDYDIPDPFGMPQSTYDQCAATIKEYVEKVVKKMRANI